MAYQPARLSSLLTSAWFPCTRPPLVREQVGMSPSHPTVVHSWMALAHRFPRLACGILEPRRCHHHPHLQLAYVFSPSCSQHYTSHTTVCSQRFPQAPVAPHISSSLPQSVCTPRPSAYIPMPHTRKLPSLACQLQHTDSSCQLGLCPRPHAPATLLPGALQH